MHPLDKLKVLLRLVSKIFPGTTGRSTIPHLHYQLNCKGKPADPIKIKKQPDNVRLVLRD